MAESKREAPEEKYELPVPPFDADAYVAKEVINTRATIVLALFGVLLGVVSNILVFALDSAGANKLPGVAVLLFGLVAVKGVLETCGVDATEWGRKDWLTHGAVLFFTWLSVWVLLQNPPFVG